MFFREVGHPCCYCVTIGRQGKATILRKRKLYGKIQPGNTVFFEIYQHVIHDGILIDVFRRLRTASLSLGDLLKKIKLLLCYGIENNNKIQSVKRNVFASIETQYFFFIIILVLLVFFHV